MSGAAQTPDLVLLVASPPGAHRDGRAALDVALAAASLDRVLEVYFLGSGLLQLARELDPAPALLPGGYRGWAGLPELGPVRLFADREEMRRHAALGVEFRLAVEPLPAAEMQKRWRRARHAMVL